MKHPEPYYREQRGTWYVQIGKTQHRLIHGNKDETEAEAYRLYHGLMANLGLEVPGDDLTLGVACDLFLDHAEKTVAHGTYEQYRIKLQDLANHFGRLRLAEFGPEQVDVWVKAHEWSDSTRRGAITAAKVCLAWCARKKYLAESPIGDVRRPKMGRRERTIAPEERALIRSGFADGFSDLLDALTWTGARPGEIMRLESRHLDLEGAFAALPGKTTGATGEAVAFPLIPPMLALCRRLAGQYPEGPIFRNADGNPWTVNAVRCRMRRLRARVKRQGDGTLDGVTAYTFRHSFATDALERGIPLTDVAALMNHRDIRTTMNYNHVKDRREHLKRQAEKAQGEPTPSA